MLVLTCIIISGTSKCRFIINPNLSDKDTLSTNPDSNTIYLLLTRASQPLVPDNLNVSNAKKAEYHLRMHRYLYEEDDGSIGIAYFPHSILRSFWWCRDGRNRCFMCCLTGECTALSYMHSFKNILVWGSSSKTVWNQYETLWLKHLRVQFTSIEKVWRFANQTLTNWTWLSRSTWVHGASRLDR